MCRDELKGKTGRSILRLSCGRSLTRTHPSPRETHAGQLLWALAPRAGVNTHRRNSAWTLSSCKHVERAQKPRRVQALTLLHTKQIWVNKEPKKTPQRCAPLTSSQFPTPAWKSLVSSSFELQLLSNSAHLKFCFHTSLAGLGFQMWRNQVGAGEGGGGNPFSAQHRNTVWGCGRG